MMDLLCSGPGPHDPTSGVLGAADLPVVGMLCPPCALLAESAQPVDVAQPVTIDPAVIDTLTSQVHAASTMALLRAALVNVLDAINPAT